MIKIEALEPIIVGRLRMETGDRLTIDDETAKRYCAAGFAKAVNGEVETGERKVIKAVVEPHSSNLATVAGNVEVK